MSCCGKGAKAPDVVDAQEVQVQLDGIQAERQKLNLERAELNAEWSKLQKAQAVLKERAASLEAMQERIRAEDAMQREERRRTQDEHDFYGRNRDRDSLARALSKKPTLTTPTVIIGASASPEPPKRKGRFARRWSVEPRPSQTDRSRDSWASDSADEKPSPPRGGRQGKRGSIIAMIDMITMRKAKSSPAGLVPVRKLPSATPQNSDRASP